MMKRKKPAAKIPKGRTIRSRPKNPDKHQLEPMGGEMGVVPMAGKLKKVLKL